MRPTAQVKVPLGTMAVAIARLEVKVDGIESTLQTFIKTATSPDLGFAAAATMNMVNSEVKARLDDINKDHNERLVKLEGLSGRVLLWAVGVLGGICTDIILHVTGVKP